MPSEKFKNSYPRDLYRGLIQFRTGIGVTNPLLKRFNVRIETELNRIKNLPRRQA